MPGLCQDLDNVNADYVYEYQNVGKTGRNVIQQTVYPNFMPKGKSSCEDSY